MHLKHILLILLLPLLAACAAGGGTKPASVASDDEQLSTRPVERWDHLITIAPDGPSRTRYRDTVDIEAGLLTPFVWLFAQFFYRHRQRRWRALAQTGFRALPAEKASLAA